MSRTVTEQMLLFSNTTFGNATTLRHGLLPKLSGNSTDVLKGDGTFGAGGGGGGASTKLYDFTVTGADKASIDTNVDGTTVANFSGFDILEVFIIVRTDDAGASPTVDITLNNDNTAIYDTTRVRNANATVSGGTPLAQTTWQLIAHGSGGSGGYAAVASLRMPGYAGTTFWKVADMSIGTVDATATNDFVEVRALGYQSTAAITRFKIAAQGAAKLKVGSRVMVYGR